ncbi:hypothetical protein C7T94_09365 [Pedobacter yulinensis]|uniref:Response regulatory domain-containing protein n=1 Tax=Pedobacter yulinensis TaxID=2126353 RepID=A0A2T3HK49_9SPHI|nr:response regulator [Pedobacter yulinensis]PST82838.1 hypothetical protein C7T94_09365 [Pedobacter yulinensis]
MIPLKTVAVVDDREDNLDAIQSILYLANYRVFACQSVCAFEQGLTKLRPDLMIIDIHLGPEDGRLLCRRLKQQPHLAQVPVLLLSARPGFVEAELNNTVPMPSWRSLTTWIACWHLLKSWPEPHTDPIVFLSNTC